MNGLTVHPSTSSGRTVKPFCLSRLKWLAEVPKQLNSREENVRIKEGQVPEAWDKPEAQAKRRQKDTEARKT